MTYTNAIFFFKHNQCYKNESYRIGSYNYNRKQIKHPYPIGTTSRRSRIPQGELRIKN